MRKTTVRIMLGALLIISLVGCANTRSSNTSSEQVKKPEAVKQSKHDVMKLFGQPQTKEIDKDGTERWIYPSKIIKRPAMTAFLRAPLPEGTKLPSDTVVTAETDGTNQISKLTITPKPEEPKVLQEMVVTFDGDTVREYVTRMTPTTMLK